MSPLPVLMKQGFRVAPLQNGWVGGEEGVSKAQACPKVWGRPAGMSLEVSLPHQSHARANRPLVIVL